MATNDEREEGTPSQSEYGELVLLGFDVPLNNIPKLPLDRHKDGSVTRMRCPNAVVDWAGRPLTVREHAMMTMMANVMEKPQWEQKVLNDSIVTKWKSEAVGEERNFSETMFEFCIQELRGNATFLQSTGIVPAISANAVVYSSDSIVPAHLKDRLKKAVASLEDVPDSEQDWHPRSGDQVLDLVHPSLFPLIYGKTLLLRDGSVAMEDAASFCGQGEVVPIPSSDQLFQQCSMLRRDDENFELYSERFQWLPAEVAFVPQNKVRITSYINNLHPAKHTELYTVIEAVISKAIPLWDLTLTHIFKKERMEKDYPNLSETTHGYYPPRIIVAGLPEWTVDEPMTPENKDDEEDDFGSIEYGVNWRREGLVQPEPSEDTYKARTRALTDIDAVDLRTVFAEEGLQVIIKLANIHLTPDSPAYEGGKWHIEGLLNEHICASALLYYDNDNITDSALAFRERVDTEAVAWGYKDEDCDRGYEQGEYEHMIQFFGVEGNDNTGVQELGHVLTKEGRLITFPNVLQHRVKPFRLQDPSKPGHRKILALFLVDPYLRIPSTANVPPQQKEWWAGMVRGLDRVSKLPPELVENILDQAGDFPISPEEAKELRLELMNERSTFVDEVNTDYERYKFEFCEH